MAPASIPLAISSWFPPFDSLVPVWALFGDVCKWTVRYTNPLDVNSRTEHRVTWFVHDVSKWHADITLVFPRAILETAIFGDAYSAVKAIIDDDDAAAIANQLAMDAFWAARPDGEECQR